MNEYNIFYLFDLSVPLRALYCDAVQYVVSAMHCCIVRSIPCQYYVVLSANLFTRVDCVSGQKNRLECCNRAFRVDTGVLIGIMCQFCTTVAAVAGFFSIHIDIEAYIMLGYMECRSYYYALCS